MDKYIGKMLDGRYEIHELLGSGGMAVVYKAYDVDEKKTVAIKILKDEFLDNEEFVRRFKNESQTIAMLSHPNIVKVFDVSFGDNFQYIVMEYIDGITLKEYIEQQSKIKWKDAVFFTTQILKALEHAHEKAIVHRDIKPQNIMLLKDGTIKVTDFGIAKFSSYETRTMTGKTIGSVHYISPEQARGDATDEKADIYSVGVMLYEMLTGQLPFEADNAVSVAIMQLQSDPKPLRDVDGAIPEGLEEITLKAMQKNPKFRYKSATDMLSAIEEFRKNPSIRFEYKYFKDENPTKYIDVINSVKGNKSQQNYGDEYIEDDSDGKKSSKAISIVVGVGIAVVVLSVVLILGLLTGWFGLSAKDVDVPDFIGKKAVDVVDSNEYNFEWKLEYAYDPNKNEGIIIDQYPKAGSKKVKEGSTITLTINSSGAKVTVPSLKGKTEEDAKSALKEVGLLYEVLSVEDSETAQGVVIGSDPQEGKEVTASSTVKIFVSKGAGDKKVTVPNIIGKSLADATNELVSKGLKVSENIKKENSSKAKDVVIATDPLPGVETTEGSAVTLTVSTGEKTEKKIPIYIDLPSAVSREVSLKVYIDGALDANNSKTLIPSYNTTYTLTVTGSSGKKNVVINLDGQKYRVYEVDFDSDSVKTVSSHTFTSASTTQEPEAHNSNLNIVKQSVNRQQVKKVSKVSNDKNRMLRH